MEVLVIGLGSMGKRRIRLLKRFGKVTNIVGVDTREDRRMEVRAMGSDVHESIQEALETHPQIQCAFVCTSPLSHSQLIQSLLSYGLHVFTELNLVLDGYEDNMKLAKEKSVKLFISSTFYYREEIQYLQKKLKKRNKLNYIYHIGQYLPDWHPWEKYNDFFIGDARTNGCREIMAIELPWLTGVFGKVMDFQVVSDNISDLKITYRDNYMLQLKHENGNKGVLVVDVVSPKAVRNLEIYGENVYFSWQGTPSSLEYFDVQSKEVKKAQLLEPFEHLEGYETFVVENAYQKEIEEFFDVVCNGKTPSYEFKQDLEILHLIDRIEGIT